jgi:molybdate transport system ATP-binding protein
MADEIIVDIEKRFTAGATIRANFRLDLAGASTAILFRPSGSAISLGNQIVVMAEGEVRQIGSVDEVFRHPTNATVAGILSVETILHGVVIDTEAGLARVRVGSGEICSVLHEELRERDGVLVCIRAEEVTLQQDTHALESARNHFAGAIESIESDGAVERITIDCGFRLVAIITRNSREEMGLGIGNSVTASVKASAIHLIRL